MTVQNKPIYNFEFKEDLCIISEAEPNKDGKIVHERAIDTFTKLSQLKSESPVDNKNIKSFHDIATSIYAGYVKKYDSQAWSICKIFAIIAGVFGWKTERMKINELYEQIMKIELKKERLTFKEMSKGEEFKIFENENPNMANLLKKLSPTLDNMFSGSKTDPKNPDDMAKMMKGMLSLAQTMLPAMNKVIPILEKTDLKDTLSDTQKVKDLKKQIDDSIESLNDDKETKKDGKVDLNIPLD